MKRDVIDTRVLNLRTAWSMRCLHSCGTCIWLAMSRGRGPTWLVATHVPHVIDGLETFRDHDMTQKCRQFEPKMQSMQRRKHGLSCDSQAEKLRIISESHNPHAGTILSQWNGPLGLRRVENGIERKIGRDGAWNGLPIR